MLAQHWFVGKHWVLNTAVWCYLADLWGGIIFLPLYYHITDYKSAIHGTTLSQMVLQHWKNCFSPQIFTISTPNSTGFTILSTIEEIKQHHPSAIINRISLLHYVHVSSAGQCWANVVPTFSKCWGDVGPTFGRCWANVFANNLPTFGWLFVNFWPAFYQPLLADISM